LECYRTNNQIFNIQQNIRPIITKTLPCVFRFPYIITFYFVDSFFNLSVLGGELIVESKLGEGSKFRACIPGVVTNEVKTVTEEEQTSVDTSDALPKHVLVVDDSPVNRKVLTAFLKKAGIVSIGTAGDGGVALSELDLALKSGYPYDFVFSDLWMPNMNGMEFIEKLRADSRFSRLPVFALTADTEFRQDARTDLFTGVLLKPVTYEKLVKVFAAAKKRNT